MQLRPGGLPVECIREYAFQLLDVLWYLHGKSVVHKNLKVPLFSIIYRDVELIRTIQRQML